MAVSGFGIHFGEGDSARTEIFEQVQTAGTGLPDEDQSGAAEVDDGTEEGIGGVIRLHYPRSGQKTREARRGQIESQLTAQRRGRAGIFPTTQVRPLDQHPRPSRAWMGQPPEFERL